MSIDHLIHSLDWTEINGGYLQKIKSDSASFHQWSTVQKSQKGKFYRVLRSLHEEITQNSCSPQQAQELLRHTQKLYERYQTNGSFFRSIFYRKRLEKSKREFQNLHKTLNFLKNITFPNAKFEIAKVREKSNLIIRNVTQEQLKANLKLILENRNEGRLPYFPEIENIDLSSFNILSFTELKRIIKCFPRLKTIVLPPALELTLQNKKDLIKICPLLKLQNEPPEVRSNFIYQITFPEHADFTSEEINDLLKSNSKLYTVDLSKTSIKHFIYDANKLIKRYEDHFIILPKTCEEVTIDASRYIKFGLYQIRNFRHWFDLSHIKKVNLIFDGSVHVQTLFESILPSHISNSIEIIDIANSKPLNFKPEYKKLFPNLKFLRAKISSETDITQFNSEKNTPLYAVEKNFRRAQLKSKAQYLSEEELKALDSQSFNSHFTNSLLIAMVKHLNVTELNLQGSTKIDDFAFLNELEKPFTIYDKLTSLDLRGTSVTFQCYLKLKSKYPHLKIEHDHFYLDRRDHIRRNMPSDLSEIERIAKEYCYTGYLRGGLSFELLEELYVYNDNSMTSSQIAELKKQIVLKMISLFPSSQLNLLYEFAKKHNIPYLIQEVLLYHEFESVERIAELSKAFRRLLDDGIYEAAPVINPQGLGLFPINLIGIESKLDNLLASSQEKLEQLLHKVNEAGYFYLGSTIASLILDRNSSTFEYISNRPSETFQFLEALIGNNDPLQFVKAYEQVVGIDNQKILQSLLLRHFQAPWLQRMFEDPTWRKSLAEMAQRTYVGPILDLNSLNSKAVAQILEVHVNEKRIDLSLDLSYEQLECISQSSALKKVVSLDLSKSTHVFKHDEVIQILKWFPNLERIYLPEDQEYDSTNDLNFKGLPCILTIGLVGKNYFLSEIQQKAENLQSLKGNWLHVLAVDDRILPYVQPDNLDFHRVSSLTNKKLLILAKHSKVEELNLTGCLSVTSDGVAKILKMKKFKSISLHECTQIDDSTFHQSLKDGSLANVEHLDLRKTYVTKSMVKALKNAYPHLKDKIEYDKDFLETVSVAEKALNAEVELVGDDNNSVMIHSWAIQKLNPSFNKTGKFKVKGLNRDELKALKDYAYTGLFQMVCSDSRKKISKYEGDLLDSGVSQTLRGEIEAEDIRTINRNNIEQRINSSNPLVAAEAKEYNRLFIKKPFAHIKLGQNRIGLNYILNLPLETIVQFSLEDLVFKGLNLLTDKTLIPLALKSENKDIDLEECRNITIKGVREILKRKEFTSMNLRNNPQIDDKLFRNHTKLGSLKKMKSLDLRGTSVTQNAVISLLKAYPKLTILYDEAFLINLYPIHASFDKTIKLTSINRLPLNVNACLLNLQRLNPAIDQESTLETTLSREALDFLLRYANTGYFPPLNFKVAKELYAYEGNLLSQAVRGDIRNRIINFFRLSLSFSSVVEIYQFAKKHNIEPLLLTSLSFIQVFLGKETKAYKDMDGKSRHILDEAMLDKPPAAVMLDEQPLPKIEIGKVVNQMVNGEFEIEASQVFLRQIPYFQCSDGVREIVALPNVNAKIMEWIFTYIHNEGAADIKGNDKELKALRDIADYFLLPVLAAKVDRKLGS